MSDKPDSKVILGAGVYIGILDQEGSKIHIGDTLSFDPKEWGGPYEFVIEITRGEISLPGGGPSDVTEWCTIIKKYDD
jgi:hypothetical protein